VRDSHEHWTVLKALTWTAEAFKSREMPSARLEAELLLPHATGLERIQLYAQHDRPLVPEERSQFRELVKRRMAGEPSQYLTGAQEFWSLPFRVTSAVLIPRGDTEVVVEEALGILRSRGLETPLVVDVGTGSGAIAVALASELPSARVVGCDISSDALEIARDNVQRNQVDVKLISGTLPEVLDRMSDAPDMIVSNPPYIETGKLDGLQIEIREHEPMLALDGGDDGLRVYREIIASAAKGLAPEGSLVLEIGDQLQAEAVDKLLMKDSGWKEVRTRNDYSGLARVVMVSK
jgi:release factor glutamine methyltransferase